MSEVATTNNMRYGLATCAKTMPTLAQCTSCSNNPPDGSQHGWLWKRISQHLCNVKLGAEGGVAVGQSGVVHSMPSAFTSHVCTQKCYQDTRGIRCGKFCPGAAPSNLSGFGETTGTGTASGGFKLCETPYFELPKVALFGAGALALFSIVGHSSPMKKTLFDIAMYSGVAAFGASLIGCIELK